LGGALAEGNTIGAMDERKDRSRGSGNETSASKWKVGPNPNGKEMAGDFLGSALFGRI
jgi:hypothetical protein